MKLNKINRFIKFKSKKNSNKYLKLKVSNYLIKKIKLMKLLI